MSNALKNLRAARAWLGEGEHRWTQDGWYACDEYGSAVAMSAATSCCAIGALARSAGVSPCFVSGDEWLNRALEELGVPKVDGFNRVVKYNDALSTTYPDILALFDRAIELAEAEAEGGVA